MNKPALNTIYVSVANGVAGVEYGRTSEAIQTHLEYMKTSGFFLVVQLISILDRNIEILVEQVVLTEEGIKYYSTEAKDFFHLIWSIPETSNLKFTQTLPLIKL